MEGGVTSQELQQELQGLIDGTDLYFETAKEEFENSQISLTNPDLIDDEISQQKSVFSKLKFIYLEQETRDKFLRRISESNIQDINQDEVADRESSSKQSKIELKELKASMYEKIQELEELTKNNGKLYENYQGRINETNSMINEMNELQNEIDLELNEGAYSEILKALPTNADANLSDYINSTNSNIDQLKQDLNSINNQIVQAEKTQQIQTESIKQLKSQLIDLTDQIKSNPVKQNDEQQLYAKWCRESIEILIKLSDLNNITIKILDQNLFRLSISWSRSNQLIIEFDRYFTVTKVSGTNKTFPTMIPITEDMFIQALVDFVNSLSEEIE